MRFCLSENFLEKASPRVQPPSKLPGNTIFIKVKYENSTWDQYGETIPGDTTNDKFGSSVSLNNDGTIVVIGAPDNDSGGNNSGHVKVYKHFD